MLFTTYHTLARIFLHYFQCCKKSCTHKKFCHLLSLMKTCQVPHRSSCKWPDCAFQSHQSSAFQSCSSETAVSKLIYTCQPYPCLVQHKDELAGTCSVCKYTLFKSFITSKRGYQQIIPVLHLYEALLGINQKS